MPMDRNSLAYWYPKISHLPIPMPKTTIVECVFGEGWNFISEDTFRKVLMAAKELGFPCFLKTDLDAAKYDYLSTCYIGSPSTLRDNMENLRDTNFCHDRLFSFFGIREFIPLDAAFTAFNGLPIAPERRYFIEEGKVQCHHPYWPPDAIEFYGARKQRAALMQTYGPLLEVMNRESEGEIALLTRYAEMVSEILPEYWSVDFALGKNGAWYLIDMADGDKSWHEDTCPDRVKRNT